MTDPTKKEELWLEDSLSSFSALTFKRYTVVKRKAAKTGKEYDSYRIVVSPVEAPSMEIATEVFRSQMERIKALRISNPDAKLKVSVEGRGKDRIVTWSSVQTI